MNYTDLQIGTKLELEIYDMMGDVIEHQFVSELEWIEEGNIAFIAAPISEGVVYPVRIGSKLNAYFINRDDLYRFKAKVISRGMKDNIALLKVLVEEEFEKIQRRQFFRFDCSVPVKFRVIYSMRPDDNEKILFIKTFSKDLSGGGLCMVTEERVNIDELVECIITLDNEKVISFKGKVVRSERLELDDRIKYETGITFKKIEDRDREAIIGFIFREQRKLRKKGLI